MTRTKRQAQSPEGNGVAPKSGTGPRGGIPRGQDRQLWVAPETRQGIDRIASGLQASYGRPVSLLEALDVATAAYRRNLNLTRLRTAALRRLSGTERERIPKGEGVKAHASPTTYEGLLATISDLNAVLGRKPSLGETVGIVVRDYLGDGKGAGR